jgi:cytochrome c oxidase subunit 3
MTEAVYHGQALPVGSLGRNSVGWWGVLCLLATEASLFAYLLFSYYYFLAQRGIAWLPVRHPSLMLALPDTIILVISSVAIWWGERGLTRGARTQHLAGLGAGILLGVVFVVVQLIEWKSKTYSLTSGAYGSFYFITTGFHLAHVIVGLLMLSLVFAWSAARLFNRRRHAPVMVSSVYWHFVDVVWLVVFFTYYVIPYLW